MDLKRITNDRRFLGTAYFAAILSLLILVNVILNALVTRFSWYFYTEERYEHTVGDASSAVFRDVGEEDEVRVIFCMAEEKLEGDVAYSLVLNTFRQLSARHDFIKIEFVNIFLHPGAVRDYAKRTTVTGEEVSYAITEQSVILVGEGEGNFRVESLESFFILDEDRVITGYNGEEIAIAGLAWLLADTHPVAGFTNTHGENFDSMLAFSVTLVAAGYDMMLLDLTEPIPESVDLIVIANPRWDLDRSAAGSGIDAELDRLASFTDGGGTLFVSLDPYAKSELTGLTEFLSARGLIASKNVIRDTVNSISTDGYTLEIDLADSGFATAVRDRVGAPSSARAVVSSASSIECRTVGAWAAEPILVSSPDAETYKNGTLVSTAGSYPVFAVARKSEGGVTSTVFLTSSVYLLANDALNSAIYRNRATLLASLEGAVGRTMPVGCTILPVGNDRLEGLTMGTARLYAVLLSVAVPLVAVGIGSFITIRRKFR